VVHLGTSLSNGVVRYEDEPPFEEGGEMSRVLGIYLLIYYI